MLNQHYPVVSLETNGDFVVAWQSRTRTGYPATYGIVARRFASTGTGLATEFVVNTYTENQQRFPSIGVDGDGDFVITWQATDFDGDLHGVFARRFDTDGMRAGPRLPGQLLHHAISRSIRWSGSTPPAISSSPGRATARTRAHHGIFAQRYDNVAILDVDGNGEISPLTDGVMILRFMFGFTGPTLVSGAVDARGLPALRRADDPDLSQHADLRG